MAPTTRTNQQAYCKVIKKDIDRESKYLFTCTHTHTHTHTERGKKYFLQVAKRGF